MKTFTGSTPFDLHLSITVALAIMRGDRPSRPIHPALTHILWELMECCWSQEPDSRPDMPEALRVLRSPLAPLSFHDQEFVNLIVLFCTARPLNPALILTRGHFPPHPARTRTVASRVEVRGREPCPWWVPEPCDNPTAAYAELGNIVPEFTR